MVPQRVVPITSIQKDATTIGASNVLFSLAIWGGQKWHDRTEQHRHQFKFVTKIMLGWRELFLKQGNDSSDEEKHEYCSNSCCR